MELDSVTYYNISLLDRTGFQVTCLPAPDLGGRFTALPSKTNPSSARAGYALALDRDGGFSLTQLSQDHPLRQRKQLSLPAASRLSSFTSFANMSYWSGDSSAQASVTQHPAN